VALVAPRRVLLVVNPAARRGRESARAAAEAFQAAGVALDARETSRPGDAEALVKQGARASDAVFVLGGDGTVMEVLSAVASTARAGRHPSFSDDGEALAVGILPGGTGNLVASALGIPRDVRRAVRVLLAGDVRPIDLGMRGDGGAFAFAAGTGVDTAMVSNSSAAAKRRFGVLAYALAAARAALRLERFHLRATVDGVTHELPATSVLLANFGAVLGGRIVLGPGIRENDGLLDLCVFSPSSAVDAVRLGWRLFRHDFRTDPAMHFLRGQRFSLETDPPRPFQADGELLQGCGLEVSVAMHAARLLVPRAVHQVR